MLLSLPYGVLDSVQDISFFEIVRGCTVPIPQAYRTFCRTVESEWEKDANVGWFPSITGYTFVSGIPAREDPESEQSLDNAVISVHVDTVKVFLFWNSCSLFLMLAMSARWP